MQFTLYLPYQSSLGINNDVEGYYKNEQEYVDALETEEKENGMLVYDIMSNGGVNTSVNYNAFGQKAVRDYSNIKDNILFASAECVLYSPNGASLESVDSIIDKFASQCEFLVMANFDTSTMQAEFEEELEQWYDETKSIMQYANKMGEEWVNQNIPKRPMKIKFLNKSNREVNFLLNDCEIEEKIGRNRYLLYVKKMSIIK